MKKTLLISAALLIGASGFAQGNRIAHKKITPVLRQHRNNILDVSTTPMGNPNPATTKFVPISNPNSTCAFPIITKAGNVLSVTGGPANNCLTYNSDLNAVSWTSRSGAWTFPGSSNGAIKAKWNVVSGAAWDSMILYKDSTSATAGGRYPGGAILNPKGNTNIANAYWLAAGPHVTTAFDGLYYCARPASGSYHTPPNNKINTLVIPGVGQHVFGNLYNNGNSPLNVDMQAIGTTKVMVSGPLNDPFFTNTGVVKWKGAILATAKTPFVNSNLTWKTDSIIPGFYTNGIASGTGYMFSGDGRLAFGPDSLKGYCVFEGRLATNYGNSADSMMAPVVYKTTDGGITWVGPLLPGYDWRCKHPEVMQNVAQGLITTYNPALGNPGYRDSGYVASYFSLDGTHGADLTVDANGFLHYVTTVVDPYKNNGTHNDSLIYTYTYNYDYINYHPLIWDFITDGTDWKTMLVDSILSSSMGSTATQDTTALHTQWYDPSSSAYYGYGSEINVSRSLDGTKIFYGWSQSDFNVTSNYWNVQPDLYIKGFNVTTGKFSSTNNITQGTILAYFPRLSDISYYDNTNSQYVVPAMVTNGTVKLTSPSAWNAIVPVDFRYVNCGTFNAASFSTAAAINPAGTYTTTNCAVGIKTYTNAFVNSVSNYPNPFNGTTNIVVNLNDGKSINVAVFDAIGNMVSNKTVNGNIGNNTIVFDATNLNAGVYYYTVTAGYDRVTKKMVIQK